MVLTEEIINNLPLITEDEIKNEGYTFDDLLETILQRVDEDLRKDFDEDGNPIQTEFSK